MRKAMIALLIVCFAAALASVAIGEDKTHSVVKNPKTLGCGPISSVCSSRKATSSQGCSVAFIMFMPRKRPAGPVKRQIMLERRRFRFRATKRPLNKIRRSAKVLENYRGHGKEYPKICETGGWGLKGLKEIPKKEWSPRGNPVSSATNHRKRQDMSSVNFADGN